MEFNYFLALMCATLGKLLIQYRIGGYLNRIIEDLLV
jgi:hypothetical protein